MSKNEYYCDCNMIHQEVVEIVKSQMLKDDEFKQITNFFKTLGDPTRIKIMWAIYEHEICVCDLANILSMTKSAISHQLKQLRLANLVTAKKVGKTVYYSLADEHVWLSIKNATEHIREK